MRPRTPDELKTSLSNVTAMLETTADHIERVHYWTREAEIASNGSKHRKEAIKMARMHTFDLVAMTNVMLVTDKLKGMIRSIEAELVEAEAAAKGTP